MVLCSMCYSVFKKRHKQTCVSIVTVTLFVGEQRETWGWGGGRLVLCRLQTCSVFTIRTQRLWIQRDFDWRAEALKPYNLKFTCCVKSTHLKWKDLNPFRLILSDGFGFWFVLFLPCLSPLLLHSSLLLKHSRNSRHSTKLVPVTLKMCRSWNP